MTNLRIIAVVVTTMVIVTSGCSDEAIDASEPDREVGGSADIKAGMNALGYPVHSVSLGGATFEHLYWREELWHFRARHMRDGVHVALSFYDNGVVKQIAVVRDGELEGASPLFDDNGIVNAIRIYDRGELEIEDVAPFRNERLVQLADQVKSRYTMYAEHEFPAWDPRSNDEYVTCIDYTDKFGNLRAKVHLAQSGALLLHEEFAGPELYAVSATFQPIDAGIALVRLGEGRLGVLDGFQHVQEAGRADKNSVEFFVGGSPVWQRE
jgi:hypothetical protein